MKRSELLKKIEELSAGYKDPEVLIVDEKGHERAIEWVDAVDGVVAIG